MDTSAHYEQQEDQNQPLQDTTKYSNIFGVVKTVKDFKLRLYISKYHNYPTIYPQFLVLH